MRACVLFVTVCVAVVTRVGLFGRGDCLCLTAWVFVCCCVLARLCWRVLSVAVRARLRVLGLWLYLVFVCVRLLKWFRIRISDDKCCVLDVSSPS